MATNYEIIEAEAKNLPIQGLLKVEDNGQVFYTSLKPFGPGNFLVRGSAETLAGLQSGD